MKTITKKYKVYSFDELSDKAKEKALEQEIEFWLEINYEDLPKCIKTAIDKVEKIHPHWFTGSYIYQECQKFLVDTIRANKYQYLESGEFFNWL